MNVERHPSTTNDAEHVDYYSKDSHEVLAHEGVVMSGLEKALRSGDVAGLAGSDIFPADEESEGYNV